MNFFLLHFNLLVALNALRFQIIAKYYIPEIDTTIQPGNSSLTLYTLPQSLYSINLIEIHYQNQTYINIYDITLESFFIYQIDLKQVLSVYLDIQFLTIWDGVLSLQLAGYVIGVNGTQQIYETQTYTLMIGPVIQEGPKQGVSQLQQITNDLYSLDYAEGKIASVFRSIRLISNFIFPFSWNFAIIFMTGPNFLPINLYYFTGMISSLTLRNQITDFALIDCSHCQVHTQSRSMYYIFDLQDQSPGFNQCLKSSNYSNNQFYNFDFTLLWIIVMIALIIILRSKLDPSFIMIRRMQLAFLEGSIIEITLLSMSKFLQVTSNDLRGLDVLLGVLGIIMVIIIFIFSLRPLIFFITTKPSDYYVQNDLSNSNQDISSQPPKRRATGYPGKIIIDNQQQSVQTQYLSPYYGIMIQNLIQKPEFNSFYTIILVDYQLHLLFNFFSGFTLPFLNQNNMYMIYDLGISFITIKIVLVMIMYYLQQNLQMIKSLRFSMIMLLQIVEQVIMLSILISILDNQYIVQTTVKVFEYNQTISINQTNSTQSPFDRADMQQQVKNLYGSGQLIINLIISYICIAIINQSIYVWTSLTFTLYIILIQIRNNSDQPQPKNTQQIQKPLIEMQPHTEQHSQNLSIIHQNDIDQVNQSSPFEGENHQQPLTQMKEVEISNLSHEKIQMQELKIVNHNTPTQQNNFVTPTQKDVLNSESQSSSYKNHNGEGNSYQSGKVVQDNKQGKVMVPKKRSLDYSKIFNQGTIKFAKSELICEYSFQKQVIVGGIPVGPEHRQFTKNVGSNQKILLNDMRIKGLHFLKFRNINKQNIHQSIPGGKNDQERSTKNHLYKIKLNNITLQPGDPIEVLQQCSFDYLSSQMNSDKIEIKGVYHIEDELRANKDLPQSEKIIKFELCNNELRLINVIAYTNKQFQKLQQSSKEYFSLIFEQKLNHFNLKNIESYVKHHELLHFDIDSQEQLNSCLQLSAYFGKISLVIANSPFINFHFIIECLTPKDIKLDNKKQNTQENNDQYILISLFVKKSCDSLTKGHQIIAESYCQELLLYFSED